ncbi:MAG: xanthine dehydrogenase family protein molybdopterin-binding subunit [Spirochaetota bacterium]
MNRNIGDSVRRVDALDKAGGYARYLADLSFEDLHYARMIRALRSHAYITAVHVPDLPEGYFFITKDDIPAGGKNEIQQIEADWPVFCDGEVRFYGETVGMLVGPDKEQLLELEQQISIEYEELEAALTIDEGLALKGGPLRGDDNLYTDIHLTKGNPEKAFQQAVEVIEDEVTTGYQEHIYMETQSLVGSYEDGKYVITASCQCPFYIRKAVASVLNTDYDQIVVRQATTGGAFGGKEHFPDIIAAPLVVAVNAVRKPIQVIYDRSEDISFTAKRHPSQGRFRTGIDKDGNIIAMDVDLAINAGAYLSCSNIVLQRAIFSANSVYNIPNVHIRGRSVATHAFPADAFRGFGAPQGIFLAEMHMSHIARQLGVQPVELKKRYFITQGELTVTNGKVHDVVKLPAMLDKVALKSGLYEKLQRYTPGSGRGIGVSFYNHGAGFTGNGEQEIIKGKVRLRRETGGTVSILLSNVEMGQGLQTTFPKIAARVLELPLDDVRCVAADTSVVPDSGPTVASRSLMVVGKLVERAAAKLKERWDEPGEIEIEEHYVHPSGYSWDQNTFQGDAYPTYGWGICVVEVSVDELTNEVETTGIWTIHDVGEPIDEMIVHGQVHGGVIQALGYGSMEKLEYTGGGFRQNTLADYIIPTSLDFPMMSSQLEENPYEYGPFGAKGLGELVFDGAAAAFADAVQYAIDRGIHTIPVTPEYITEVKHSE